MENNEIKYLPTHLLPNILTNKLKQDKSQEKNTKKQGKKLKLNLNGINEKIKLKC